MWYLISVFAVLLLGYIVINIIWATLLVLFIYLPVGLVVVSAAAVTWIGCAMVIHTYRTIRNRGGKG